MSTPILPHQGPFSHELFPYSVVWLVPSKTLGEQVYKGAKKRLRPRLLQPRLYTPFDAHTIIRSTLTANWSLLQFFDQTRTRYTTDLLFEIDVKLGKVGAGRFELLFEGRSRTFGSEGFTEEPTVDHIDKALTAARAIVDVLDEMGVDRRALSLIASRRGVHLYVDWTVVGPLRLHEAGLLVASVCQRAGVATDLDPGPHEVEVDTRFYFKSDRNRCWTADEKFYAGKNDIDGDEWVTLPVPTGSLVGPPIRCPTAYHHEPSLKHLYRAVPCPLAWLERPDLVFHGSRRAWGQGWDADELWGVAVATRAARHPDACAELLPVASGLRDLHEALSDGTERVPTSANELRRRGLAITTKPQGRSELTDVNRERAIDLIRRAGGVVGKIDEDKVKLQTCLFCRKVGKAAILLPSGVYNCFGGTCGRKSFATVCISLGLEELIPRGVQAMKPTTTTVPDGDAPEPPTWAEAQVHDFARLEDVWDFYQGAVTECADGRDVLVLAGGCGTGKSENTRRVLVQRSGAGHRYRVFGPRHDMHGSWLTADPDAIPLMGLRTGGALLRCRNPEAELVRLQGDSPGAVLCPRCPERQPCREDGYLSQGFGLDRNYLLTHAHLPYADMTKFDNGSTLDFIDEGAFEALIRTARWSRRDLNPYRLHVLEGDAGARRIAQPDALERVLCILEDRLTLATPETRMDGIRLGDDDPIQRQGHARGRALVEYLLTGYWTPPDEILGAYRGWERGLYRAVLELHTDDQWREQHVLDRLGGHFEATRSGARRWVRSDEDQGLPVQTAEDRRDEHRRRLTLVSEGETWEDRPRWRPDAHLIKLVDALTQDILDYERADGLDFNTRLILTRGTGQELALRLIYFEPPRLPSDQPVVIANATATRESVERLLPGRTATSTKLG